VSEQSRVGIYGVGAYLPEEIRKNDWWPEATVEEWRRQMAKNLVRPKLDADDVGTEGVQRTLVGMSEFADDPFKGAKERRVMPKGMLTSDMETRAAQDAIARAGIRVDEIDLLLTYSRLPDYLNVPSAPIVHKNLGLPEKCMSLGIEAVCNSFMMQMALAEQMIKGGKARYALLVQSSGTLHLCNPSDHHSVWFGDAATAVVVGPVSPSKGLLATSHRTDGELYRALVTGCPGTTWYSGERIQLYTEDRAATRKMLLVITDLGKQVISEALAEAGHTPEDVNYYATHQSTHWFRKVTQEYIGLVNAKSVDTFSWTGSMGACNVPFMLAMGEREGMLKDNDLVAMYSGGSGITWSGMALRWGR
jgi:3-oxoacyl-[acyl-carrier-protein] synthase-3